MLVSDTIIAPATAVGEGGIAVVRISGPQSLEALKSFFRPTNQSCSYSSHRLFHGILVNSSEEHIDEVMAVYMAAPHTYTRDDVVEIHCHGSSQVVKTILDLYSVYGLRLAEPGEFTYRAFINGRLDLSQAEAVARLIHAKTESSRKLALSQVEGLLSQKIYAFTERIKNILIFIEAWIDFPEEDLPDEDLQRIQNQIVEIQNEMSTLTDTYNKGRLLTEGASILLVGRPNAGKSSLLNALLGEERAIVTDVPGTTRDILEEGISIAGVPVRLVDTAGLRHSDDPVEKEGIRRAKNKLEQADLVLFLVDGSQNIDDQDLYINNLCQPDSTFLVSTKQDLPTVADLSFTDIPCYPISIKSGQGLDQLKIAIADYLLGGDVKDRESVMLTEQRHYDALISASRSLQQVYVSLQNELSFEFISIDLRDSLQYLGQISGETTIDSVLDGIFSSFCIGK